MQIRTALPALSLVFLGCALAPAARAQEAGVRLHGRHLALAFHLGHPVPAPFHTVEREWIAGHWETISEQVWIAGREERVWVEPEYAWRHDACGRAYRVCVRPGCWKTICVPGHIEARARQAWVEGGWRVRGCRG